MKLITLKRDVISQTSAPNFLNWPQKYRSPGAGLTRALKNTAKADAQLTFPPGESEGPGFCVYDRIFRFPPEVFQTPEVPPRFSLTRLRGAALRERAGAEPDGGGAGARIPWER